MGGGQTAPRTNNQNKKGIDIGGGLPPSSPIRATAPQGAIMAGGPRYRQTHHLPERSEGNACEARNPPPVRGARPDRGEAGRERAKRAGGLPIGRTCAGGGAPPHSPAPTSAGGRACTQIKRLCQMSDDRGRGSALRDRKAREGIREPPIKPHGDKKGGGYSKNCRTPLSPQSNCNALKRA